MCSNSTVSIIKQTHGKAENIFNELLMSQPEETDNLNRVKVCETARRTRYLNGYL